MSKYLKIISLIFFCLSITSSPLQAEEKKQADKESPSKENSQECSDEDDDKDEEDEAEEKDQKKENKKNCKKDDEEKEKPPEIGNFSLPTSQQPSGLFSFGGNLIDEGEIELTFFSDEFKGKNRSVLELIPGVLFGVSENFSVYFNFPVTPKFTDQCQRSSGFEDFYVQFEYALYNKTTFTYSDQATIVAGLTIPTGSIRKTPPTGIGAPGFFLGGTYYHTTVQWVFFTCQGATITTSDHKSKFGDFYLYQFGASRTICSPKDSIYAVMLELNGQYNKKNRIRGHIDHDSGGNVIYLTPSFWVSSKTLMAQFGISLPVQQHLFGKQRKFDYVFNFNFAWSFYKK